MTEGQLTTPSDIVDARMYLAGWYSYLAEIYAGLENNRPSSWMGFRKTAKTDKEADRMYEASENGQKLNETK